MAGSIRRKKADVGDIDHVVIPRVAAATAGNELALGLYAAQSRAEDLVWERCDRLLEMGIIEKGVDAGGRTCWGMKKRTVLFNGVKHEVHSTDEAGWVPQLVIRTGPAELSKQLVTELGRAGRYVQDEGHLRYAGGASSGSVRMVADEREYFRLCGVSYIVPEAR